MSTADSLPIEDVFPAAPDSTPAQEPVVPPVEEKTPEPVTPAPQDKAPQQPPQMIPKWRLDEVLEKNRALMAERNQHNPQQPQPNAPKAPTQDQFATYDEFFDAKAAFTAREAARQEWATLNRQQQQEAQGRTFQERVQAADTSFDQKLYEASTTNPKILEKLANAPTLHPALQMVLKESDSPISLAEHLADNPAIVLELNRMSPDKAIAALVRMENKLTTVSGGPSKMPSAKAPNLDPVGGGTTPSKKDPYAKETSVEDYVAATRRLPKR